MQINFRATENLKQVIELPSITLTDAKVEKFALAFFSFISFSIANSALAAGAITTLLFGIPLYLLTAALVIRAFNIKDYENPQKLSAYKEKARHQNFESLVREHGFENIMKHEILSKKAFAQQYLDYCLGQTAYTVIRFYNDIQAAVKKTGIKFDVPPPQKTRNQTTEEIRKTPATEISQKHDLAKLAQHQMVNPELLKVDEQIKELENKAKEDKDAALATFRNSKEEAIDKYLKIVGAAKMPVKPISTWYRSITKLLSDLSEASTPSAFKSDFERFKTSNNPPDGAKEAIPEVYNNLPIFIKEAEKALQKHLDTVILIEADLKKKKAAIDASFSNG